MLGSVHVQLDDIGDLTMNDIVGNPRLTLLCSDIDLLKEVDVYGGVMSECKTLVLIGGFMEYSDNEGTSTSVSVFMHAEGMHACSMVWFSTVCVVKLAAIGWYYYCRLTRLWAYCCLVSVCVKIELCIVW